MTRRRTWLLAGGALVVVCLFAGRFTAELLADRWWAAQFSDEASRVVTRWHLWALGMGGVAVIFATAWFVLQMLIVIRAVGSVQILRDVGGLQFREVVRPGALKTFALGAGVCLGIVTGISMAGEWPAVLLGIHGLTMGITDPLLQHDAGWYVARLPLWQLLHSFTLALALLALVTATVLYAVMGALRLDRRRPAINDHARRHLGALLALVALVIAWGFLLRTSGVVAQAGAPDPAAGFHRNALVGPALAGTALMVAALSALWSGYGRHALLAAGWAVLGVATLVARTGVPLLLPENATSLPDSLRQTFEDSAFGLGARDGEAPATLGAAPLFERPDVRQLFGSGAQVVAISAARLPVANIPRPVWLALIEPEAGPPAIVAIAADTAGAGGSALAYRLQDSLAYPTLYSLVKLGPAAVRPGAPDVAAVESARGVPVGGSLRRLMLSWATQSRLAFGAPRIDWALHPMARLNRLAPFADWSGMRSSVQDGRVVWLADGYIASSNFPLTRPEPWLGGSARLLRAGFIGVIDAESGATRIFRRPDGGALAEAWADLSRGLVEPPGALPTGLLAAAGPASALADVQAQILVQRLAAAGGAELVRVGVAGAQLEESWTEDASPMLSQPVALGGADHLFAVISMTGTAPPAVTLLGTAPLGSPAALERMWGRFATFAPIQDSVLGDGAHLRAGSVHLWSSPQGLAALEVTTAARPGARPAIVWVSVAVSDRLGAGRTFELAWQNLLGNSSPIAPGQGGSTLEEARRWMQIADEALRSGDWGAFGRAFEALRGVLQAGK